MSELSLSDRSAFLIEHLNLAEATGDPEARWERFQIENLNNESLFGIDVKTRQGGFSWVAAADAVADSCIVPRSVHVFVSINLDEAAEKIRYAKQIIEALDKEVRPKQLTDNRLGIELGNGSRLISHPCKPVRGKPKARVYLDEFAHYPKDREIYAAALPATTRGGYLRIGSSPLGASGLFWEIYTESFKRYPGFKRNFVPWWTINALCKDRAGAKQLAAFMLTEERVRLFGTARLIEIFENMVLEDFQQEYECAWIDEATAWITWDEIKRNQVAAQSGDFLCWKSKDKESAMEVIEQVALAIKEDRIERVLAGGMDIGRTRNTTELYFVGKGTTGQLPLRLMMTLDGVEFDDQREVAARALDVLPVTKFLIDRSGLGMQIAEQLAKQFGYRAEGVDFTNDSKELWSVELKVRMQKGQVPIPIDRELNYQIHSIKKKVTAAKNVTFDTTTNEKHHADKYWALALAIWAANTQVPTVKAGKNPFYG